MEFPDSTIAPALQLFVWREICRHLELPESAATVAELLHRELGLQGLRIDRVHPTSVDTLYSSHRFLPQVVIESSADMQRALGRWGRNPTLLLDGRPKHLETIFPDIPGYTLASGPLIVDNRLQGLMHLAWSQGSAAPALLAERSRWLLEPLAAAMANHQRLMQLTAMREAAEAERSRLLSRLGRNRGIDDEVVGAQVGLKSVMERVGLVAELDVPVLILGETGTGKEVISRAIHHRSRRAEGPFIRVNCGAIPAELIDSQLFGHERGSFTGAAEQHAGWFERADGGTLFLDEIGELPIAAQVRLLRVLQDHQIERVGGRQSIHVDVRIIAATHRDLHEMVKRHLFREDLWYRVNVFPITMPPLRDRLEDIPDLARHFAQRASSRFGLRYIEPSQSELDLLTHYAWPGNVRELGAVIDRAAILGNGERLEVGKALGVEDTVRATPADHLLRSVATRTVDPNQHDLPTLDVAMRQHIETALACCRGQIEGAGGTAELLGINPHTLRARMRKLKIDWIRYRQPS